MAKLKRDERVCPFCGEHIKAVAIRCRYCQSDVTPTVEPDAQPLPAVAPAKAAAAKKASPAKKASSAKKAAPTKTAVAPPPPPEPADASRLPGVLAAARTHLTALLAGLVVLAAIGVGLSWWHAEEGSSTVAPSGELVGDDARTEVLVSAADLTQRTLSYSYKTLANDMQVAKARMTPAFRKEYVSTMAQVRANTNKNKIVLQAVAVSSAIIKATEHKATVLVFVNQTTSAGTGKKQDQQLNRNSLVITLTRGDGDWDISKLTALG